VRKYSTNPLAMDTDGDRLTDGEEVNQYKTDPIKMDTDTDELSDGDEVKQYRTNPINKDTDNDKCTDGAEVLRIHTDPLVADTDGDSVIDCDDSCPLIAGLASRNGCPAPPKVGTITNFPMIYYIVDTDQFDFSRPETGQNLERVYAYVQQCPGLGVVIEGHASREGPDARNQQLSEMRSAKIKTWLLERGVDPAKIEATFGYGSRKNAVQEPAPDSKQAKAMDPTVLENIRKQNRRMAVKVVRTCD
jgi:outer membrane protein OmpA-like peptidoglycan-associated protein